MGAARRNRPDRARNSAAAPGSAAPAPSIIDGEATRSCITPASDAVGKTILTIEGLGEKELHAVQKAWIEADVPQCGYCQSGQIMAAARLLAHNPHPTDADIDDGMTNICRCGTYPRIRAAIHRAAELAKI